MTPIGNFATLIVVQVVVFGVLAQVLRRKLSSKEVGRIILLATVFGAIFDYVFGQMLGLFGYALGFGLPFLVVNGALSYGCLFLTIALLRTRDYVLLYGWSIVLGTIYESANSVLHVWRWSVLPADPFLQEALVIFVGYAVLVFLAAAALSVFARIRTKL